MMRKLITERLGVPKGIYQTAVSIYEELIKNLIDVLDESETEYDLEFDLNPPAQIEDIIINKVKFNVEIKETSKVDSPKILGWEHSGQIKVDTGNEKPDLVYNKPFGVISLGLNLTVPENWDVEDLKIFLFENYRESISSIAHEVKHFYDESRGKKANLRSLVNYQASKKLIGSKIKPLRQLAFDLYYISDIESTVRPTEVATDIILQDIDKRKFYNFLTSNDTYQKLKRISQFSKEKLRSDLYNYIDEIKDVFEKVGLDLDDYQNDDELVNGMIDLWINTFKKRNIEVFTKLVSTTTLEYLVGLTGKKEEWRQKFIKSKLDKLMSDPNKFLDKTENLFKFVSNKMMKKIAKLYDYIGEKPMKESIVDPELYGDLINDDIYKDIDLFGKKNRRSITQITEQNTTKLLGRSIQIDTDGSMHIENNKNKMIKLRFSIPELNRVINITRVVPSQSGFKIETKLGYKKEITNDILKKILNFVDSDLNQTKIDTGSFTPSLGVTKIK